MGDRPVTRVRRITLAGGVVLETGGDRRLLIHPDICPICRRKVTADGDRDHSITVPADDQAVDGAVTVIVERCLGRPVDTKRGGVGV